MGRIHCLLRNILINQFTEICLSHWVELGLLVFRVFSTSSAFFSLWTNSYLASTAEFLLVVWPWVPLPLTLLFFLVEVTEARAQNFWKFCRNSFHLILVCFDVTAVTTALTLLRINQQLVGNNVAFSRKFLSSVNEYCLTKAWCPALASTELTLKPAFEILLNSFDWHWLGFLVNILIKEFRVLNELKCFDGKFEFLAEKWEELLRFVKC